MKEFEPENIASKRFIAFTKADFEIQNGKEPINTEIVDITKASGNVIAFGLPEPDKVVLKNDAGQITQSEAGEMRNKIFKFRAEKNTRLNQKRPYEKINSISEAIENLQPNNKGKLVIPKTIFKRR